MEKSWFLSSFKKSWKTDIARKKSWNFVMNLVMLVAVRGGHLYFSKNFDLWLKCTFDFVDHTFDWTPHSYKI